MRDLRDLGVSVRRQGLEDRRPVLLRHHMSVWGSLQVPAELRVSGHALSDALRRAGVQDIVSKE